MSSSGLAQLGTAQLGTESLGGSSPTVGVGTVLDALVRALEASNRLPGGMDYLTHEGDDLSDAGEVFPAAELHPAAVDRRTADTNRVGYVRDADGDRIGLLYDVNYDLDVQIDIYVVAGDGTHDATQLGEATKRALYQYDTQVRGDPLPAADGSPLEAVTTLTVGDGERRDELTGRTPALRRWLQRVSITFRDRINSAEEYGPVPTIKYVDYPGDGDLIEAVANEDDEAWTIESDQTRY